MVTLAQWKEELETGNSIIDAGDYYDFIPRDGDQEFLQNAFSKLPGGRSLINRIQELISDNDNSGLYIVPDKQNYLPVGELLKYVEQYADNLRMFFRSESDLQTAYQISLSAVSVVYTNDEFMHQRKISADTSLHLEGQIEDRFIDFQAEIGDLMFSLSEACLFLTKYPQITRYLLEDVVGFPLQHKPYYDLWKAGGDVVFLKGGVLLLCEYGPS